MPFPGANGINMSGGQRWRISFARAVYSRAGILILDDIFSAVDVRIYHSGYVFGKLIGRNFVGSCRKTYF